MPNIVKDKKLYINNTDNFYQTSYKSTEPNNFNVSYKFPQNNNDTQYPTAPST